MSGEQCLRQAGFFFARGGPVGGRNQHRSRPSAVRTSVSAPLGIPPKIPVPTGSPTTWIGNPNVDPSADTAGSTPHRHPPEPFPEGEILDSPGFAAQRLPWVGDIHNRPEPCRGSLDEWITEIGLTIGLRTIEMQIETPRGHCPCAIVRAQLSVRHQPVGR